MSVFLTSDLHFGHHNVIGFCNRPYADVEEMNEALVDNWNKTVRPKDEVYALGDFFFCKEYSLFDRLNGRKTVILGNHDGKAFKRHLATNNIKTYDYYKLRQNGKLYILCHFPILSWDGMYKGTVHLHGHSHGGLDKTHNVGIRRFDVGVDSWDYKPVALETIDALVADLPPTMRPEGDEHK